MHAVPKPATRWLARSKTEDDDEPELQAADKLQTKEDDCEDDDDDDDEEDYEERSVILFNTWSDQGPRGVAPDSATGMLPEGMELDDVDDHAYMEEQQARQVTEWEEDYGLNCEDLWCRPREEWQPASIVEKEEGRETNDVVDARVPLMGSQQRRLSSRKYVSLKAPSGVQRGLEEVSQPMVFELEAKKD
jgi:hypothetical protein